MLGFLNAEQIFYFQTSMPGTRGLFFLKVMFFFPGFFLCWAFLVGISPTKTHGSGFHSQKSHFHQLDFQFHSQSFVVSQNFATLRIIGPSKKEGFDSVLRRVLGSPNHQF